MTISKLNIFYVSIYVKIYNFQFFLFQNNSLTNNSKNNYDLESILRYVIWNIMRSQRIEEGDWYEEKNVFEIHVIISSYFNAVININNDFKWAFLQK